MASFAIQRSFIPANRPEGIAVDLIGSGTAWTTGTTASLSGVSGCSILTTIVNSTDWIRIVIATGTSIGTLTVTVGGLTSTVAVTLISPFRGKWFPGL